MVETYCIICDTNAAEYECSSCGFDHFLCEGCLHDRHTGTLMFHVVDKLSQCGKERHGFARNHLEIDPYCATCDKSNRPSIVMVVTLKWSQEITITSCKNCSQLDKRLLYLRLFPGGSNRYQMKSAFSLDLLSLYRELNLTSGVSTYNVFNAIHRAQNNPNPPKQTIYQAFLRAIFEWRSMKLDTELLVPIGQSELFQGCRACPRADEEGQIHICADGCFRVPRLLKTNQAKSNRPLISHYMEPQEPVKQYLEDVGVADQAVIKLEKDCTDFYALTAPNKRKHKFLDETGVFAIFCARHGSVFRATDVFKGERFGLLDYLLMKTFKPNDKRQLTLYYDVGCKYRPHILKTPGILPLPVMQFLLILVPIFHIYAHGSKCIRQFHPRWMKNCAMTDGEASERQWPFIGQHHKTTKEMRKENRRVVLEDQFAFLWKRTQSKIPSSINKKMITYTVAVEELRRQRDALTETDDELEALTRKRANTDVSPTLRTRVFDNPESNVFRVDTNIRRNRNQIAFYHSLINRRGAAQDHKIRRNLQESISKLYKSIETARNKRNNLLAECDVDRVQTMTGAQRIFPVTLEFNDIMDKTSGFWLVNPNDGVEGIEDSKIETYNLLQRHEEELVLLEIEKARWIQHVNHDLDLLHAFCVSTLSPDNIPWERAIRYLCQRVQRELISQARAAGWFLQ